MHTLVSKATEKGNPLSLEPLHQAQGASRTTQSPDVRPNASALPQSSLTDTKEEERDSDKTFVPQTLPTSAWPSASRRHFTVTPPGPPRGVRAWPRDAPPSPSDDRWPAWDNLEDPEDPTVAPRGADSPQQRPLAGSQRWPSDQELMVVDTVDTPLNGESHAVSRHSSWIQTSD